MTSASLSTQPIERRYGLTPRDFQHEYRERGRPVIIADGLEHWPAVSLWTFDYLSEQHGSHEVTAVLAGEGAYAEVLERLHPRDMRLSEFLDTIREQPESLLYLVESQLLREIPELQAAVPRPRHAPPDRSLTQRLWLGPAGTVTSFHQDGAGDFLAICTLFAQIRGSKRVSLVSPDESDCMYPVARVDGGARKASAVDFDAPDLAEYPRFANIHILEEVVNAGEMLFIPESWWHYVRALEPSISLSIDWIENPMGDLVSSMLQDPDPVAFAQARAGIFTLEAAAEFPGGLPAIRLAMSQLPEDAQALIQILATEDLRAALKSSD